MCVCVPIFLLLKFFPLTSPCFCSCSLCFKHSYFHHFISSLYFCFWEVWILHMQRVDKLVMRRYTSNSRMMNFTIKTTYLHGFRALPPWLKTKLDLHHKDFGHHPFSYRCKTTEQYNIV